MRTIFVVVLLTLMSAVTWAVPAEVQAIQLYEFGQTAPRPARGEYRLKFGKTAIVPRLAYTGVYDSNIFREEDDITGDWVNVITPGLMLVHERDEATFLMLSYDADIYLYSGNPDLNFVRHTGRLEGQYMFPSNFYIRAEDLFVHTADPTGDDNLFRQDEFNVRRWYNIAEVAVGYESYKFGAEIGYQNYIQRYLDFIDFWQNEDAHTAHVELSYRIFPKTRLTGSYEVSFISYPKQNNGDNNVGANSDNSQDNVQHQGFIGVRFDPTAKLRGYFRAGLGWKDFQNERSFTAGTRDDILTWVIQADLEYLYSDRLTFNLEGERSTRDTSDTRYTHFFYNSVSAGVDFAFYEKWLANLGGELEYIEYQGSGIFDDRFDTILSGELGLSYAFRDWLNLGVFYQIRGRDSTVNNEDYVSHRTGLTIAAEY
jgi:hypothetical protein